MRRFAVPGFALCLGLANLPAMAGAQLPMADRASKPMPGWSGMAMADLAAARSWAFAQDINAVYPDATAFRARIDRAYRVALREAASVTNFGGYRASLQHFVAMLDDAHVGIRLNIVQSQLFWPGFTMHYIDGRYITARSTLDDVADGEEIASCDGHPVATLAARVATYEGGHAGLESTKASSAVRVMIDQGNPWLTRPSTCIVSGHPVKLVWRPLPYEEYASRIAPLIRMPDRTVAAAPFGSDGVWVRIGTFDPQTEAERQAFRTLFHDAPAMRDKKIIVLDVRQNGGGPYDWMVALLEALYGKAYADYYARARLAIQPVYRATPEILASFRKDTADAATNGTPVDRRTANDENDRIADAIAARRPIYRQAIALPPLAAVAPASLVKARVVVLTDYNCRSVCIGFVDELKRFPGVSQVGTETFVDSRTGTPLETALPSGNGTFRVPVMTRDGRERGDNVPQKPDLLFTGDITDNAAVKAWIREVVRAS